MQDPRTFWLTVTNIVLGLGVVSMLFGVLSGVLCEVLAKRRKHRKVSREIEEDMRRMFPSRPR